MAKRGRKKGKVSKGTVVTALCVIAVFVLLAFSRGGELPARLEQALEYAFTQTDGVAQAREFVLPDENADKLVLYVISMGNSDSMLIYTPDGCSMLIDAADDDDFADIDAVCKAFGIERLTAAVATHPDADHIGAMDDVIENYAPGTFYMPDVQKDTKTYTDMIDQLSLAGTPVVHPQAGQALALGGEVQVTVLSPRAEGYEGYNDASIVLLVEYGQTSFLFTGDVEREAIEGLLLDCPGALDVDVLKVAHHGSKTSTTQEFLSATTPDIAIINAGEGNDYGHPHGETTRLLDESGAVTLRTDLHGDIAVYSDGESIAYRTAA